MTKGIHTILIIVTLMGVVTPMARGQGIKNILQKNIYEDIIKSASETRDDTKELPPRRDPFIPQIEVRIAPPPTPKEEPKKDTSRPIITVPSPPSPPPPVPKKEEKPKAPTFKITGIVWNTNRPQAIINNQVFSLGDKIEHYIIKNINKTGIAVISGETEFIIPY